MSGPNPAALPPLALPLRLNHLCGGAAHATRPTLLGGSSRGLGDSSTMHVESTLERRPAGTSPSPGERSGVTVLAPTTVKTGITGSKCTNSPSPRLAAAASGPSSDLGTLPLCPHFQTTSIGGESRCCLKGHVRVKHTRVSDSFKRFIY